MRQIAFVRHGEIVWENDDDAPLSSFGIRQCKNIALQLLMLDFNATKVFCSPLPRARESARIIMGGIWLPTYEVVDNLIEVRRGESDVDIRKRMLDALFYIYSKSRGNVVVVGHGHPLRLIIELMWSVDGGIARGKTKILEVEE